VIIGLQHRELGSAGFHSHLIRPFKDLQLEGPGRLGSLGIKEEVVSCLLFSFINQSVSWNPENKKANAGCPNCLSVVPGLLEDCTTFHGGGAERSFSAMTRRSLSK